MKGKLAVDTRKPGIVARARERSCASISDLSRELQANDEGVKARIDPAPGLSLRIRERRREREREKKKDSSSC